MTTCAAIDIADLGSRFLAGKSYVDLEQETGIDRIEIRRALRAAGFVLTKEEAAKRRAAGSGKRMNAKTERTCHNWRCKAVFRTDQDYRLCDACREMAADSSPFEV